MFCNIWGTRQGRRLSGCSSISSSASHGSAGFLGFPEAESMETDAWSRLSASSKRHQNALQSRFDLYMGFEEVDGGEDDPRAEFLCPFCSEEFDIVGLCCHIDDEHPVEAKNGVCPVCETRVGMDMVGHITMQHGNSFKMQRRRRFRRGSSGSSSALPYLKRELRDAHLQSLLGGSSYTFPTNAAPDPLLSSFISNFPVADSLKDDQPQKLDEVHATSRLLDDKIVDRVSYPLIWVYQCCGGYMAYFKHQSIYCFPACLLVQDDPPQLFALG